MPLKSNKKNKFLMYKGRPFVRCNDTIYYGNMYEEYIIKLKIKSTKQLADVEVADNVSIQLINTDPEVDIKKKIVKKAEKSGLFAALDLSHAWLIRALSIE